MNFESIQKPLAPIRILRVVAIVPFGVSDARHALRKGAILMTATVINSYTASELLVGCTEYTFNIFYCIVRSFRRRFKKINRGCYLPFV